MLKKPPISPAQPQRAKMRFASGFVLSRVNPATYPARVRLGVLTPCGLPDGLFEQRNGIGTQALGLKYVALQEEHHPNNASAIEEII